MMVVGVNCLDKGNISIEECMMCADCLPAPYIRSLKQYNNPPNPRKYGIRELIGCLRQAYYRRTIGIRDEYKPLNVLWMMKRGNYLGNIAKGTGYNELEGIHDVDVDGEVVQIRGKLDCYEYLTKEIIENKSTRLFRGFKPKETDILQLQCYVTLYKTVFTEIRGLRLVYLGMIDFRTFDVDMVDRTEYLEQRVTMLHSSVVKSVLPEKEDSNSCRFCVYKGECTGEVTPHIEKEIEIVG